MPTKQVPVARGRFEIEVVEEGSGPPLVFLHGISGLQWSPFMDALARDHTVIAPRHPGFGDASQEELDTVHDLVYAYLDLLDALDLRGVPLLGHSLGGMIAAELAATQPERFSSVTLYAPMGFFHVDEPTFDFFACTPREMAAAFFVDPAGDAAQTSGEAGLMRMVQAGVKSETGSELVETYVERAKTLATAAKYLWPLPNRGLWKRIHRISAPTTIIWGRSDGVVPPAYAQDFLDAIPGARVEWIEDASHELLLEQPEACLAAARDALAVG
ncbi:MAG: alpha/beta hydrolase [Dehalococcoidia bacterium]